jgi:MoxR-like ATPase
MQKLFKKSDTLIKKMFKEQDPDYRYFIVKLGGSSSNGRSGYLRALFEIVNGKVCDYDPKSLSNRANIPINAVESVFVRGGYEQYLQKYTKDELFIVQAHPIDSTDGECLLGAYFDNKGFQQQYKIDKNSPFIARVYESREIDNITDDIINGEKFLHLSKKEATTLSGTPLSFFLDDEQFFGPLFDKPGNKIHGFELPNPLKISFMKGKKVSDYSTYKIDFKDNYKNENLRVRDVSGESNLYAINIGLIFTNEEEIPNNNIFKQYDTIPIDSIFSKASKLLKHKGAPKVTIDSVMKFRELNDLSDERKQIITRVLKQTNKSAEETKQLIDAILSSETFDSEIAKVFEQKPVEFIKRFLLDKNAEFAKIDQDIQDRKLQADEEVEQYIQDRKLQADEEVEQYKEQGLNKNSELDAKQKTLIQTIDSKKADLEAIEKELKLKKEQLEDSESIQELAAEKSEEIKTLSLRLSELQEKYNLSENVAAITGALEFQKGQLELEKGKVNAAKEATAEANKKLQDSLALLAARFLESQIISDLVEGDYHKHLNRSDDSESTELIESPTVSPAENLTRSLIIERVYDRFIAMKRDIDKSDLAAYLTTIFQNQFTVLLGAPGTGKTSFAEQLTYALGSEHKNLSTLINIGKGWTDPKMLQGYYNPITKKYDAGSTGFFPLMSALNKVPSDEELPMSFVIFDEFNLSSPEFYLSNQLGLADNKADRLLLLGNNITVTVPLSTRYICTANTDESVEGLTPRVINRCAFINFNSDHVSYDFDDEYLEYNSYPMLGTGDQIVEAFMPSTSDIISADIKSKLEDLYEIFIEKLAANLTSRRKEQVKKFALTYSNISFVNEKLVVDHSISMFLIPLIKGAGDKYEESLIELKEVLENYELCKSVQLINEIIETGRQNFKHFSFSIA